MFVKAIECAATFTRPLHTIVRYFGSTEVHPGAATLFFVNGDGWALTCRHVAQELAAAGQIKQKYASYKTDLDALGAQRSRRTERELQRKHDFDHTKVADVAISVVNCVEGPLNIHAEMHPTLDVALLKFSNYTRLLCNSFPVFAMDGAELKQGKFLCRLGFPFPEFTNFTYDAQTDKMDWTNQGRDSTPRFPIEGMVTRHLLGADGSIAGIEMSTPGLRGQSGGPLFDAEGRIWGMQAATAHLDLDFDVDIQVVRKGNKKHIRESAILHVGHCIHVDALKTFMRTHGVAFTEG